MSARLQNTGQVPSGLLCSICRDFFKDPVTAQDGHAYCKNCIGDLFHAHEQKGAAALVVSPNTGEELTSKSVKSNETLQQIVVAYQKRVRECESLQSSVLDLHSTIRELENKADDRLDNEVTHALHLQAAESKILELQWELGKKQIVASPTLGYIGDGSRFQLDIDRKNRELQHAAEEINLLKSKVEMNERMFNRCAQYVDRNAVRRDLRDQYEREFKIASEETKRLQEKLKATTRLLEERDKTIEELRKRPSEDKRRDFDLVKTRGASTSHHDDVRQATAEAEVTRLSAECSRKERELVRLRATASKIGPSGTVVDELQHLTAINRLQDEKLKKLFAELTEKRQEVHAKSGELRNATLEAQRLQATVDMNAKELRSLTDRDARRVSADVARAQAAVDRATFELEHERAARAWHEANAAEAHAEVEKLRARIMRQDKELQAAIADRQKCVPEEKAERLASDLVKVTARVEVQNEVIAQRDLHIAARNEVVKALEAQLQSVRKEVWSLQKRLNVFDPSGSAAELANFDRSEVGGNLNAVDMVHLDAAKHDLSLARETIEDLRATLSNERRELAGVQRELERVQSLIKIDSDVNDLRSVSAEVQRLESTLARRNSELRAARDEIDRLLAAAGRKDIELAKASDELGRLQAEIDSREDEATEMMAELTTLREIAYGQVDAKSLDTRSRDAAEIARLRLVVEHRDAELRNVKLRSHSGKSIDELEADLERRNVLLREMEQDKRRLQQKVDRLERECQHAEEEIGRVREKSEELQQKNADLMEWGKLGTTKLRKSFELSPEGDTLVPAIDCGIAESVAASFARDPMSELERFKADLALKHEALRKAAAASTAQEEVGVAPSESQSLFSPPLAPMVRNGGSQAVNSPVDPQRTAFGSVGASAVATAESSRSLVEAAGLGKAAEVFELLQQQTYDINAADASGYTALQVAAAAGHVETTRCLCTAGVDVDMAQEDGVTALHLAAAAGHTEVVRCLCAAGAAKNFEDVTESTPLLKAASAGHIEVVRILLAVRADGTKASKHGVTPLQAAASFGKLSLVRLLSTKNIGDSIERADVGGWTPLYAAASAGHTDVVRFLLQASADPDAVAKNGSTPAIVAHANGHMETYRVLREAGEAGK
eukprot:TRINITY_DN49473_c0_g1_i1.p1 TRINITY_DN49473_c0_g1~~TRINITY_DN49473_c0_g1_i1.p1  ORF type:complete len:1130 (+),score=262.42 TRINITY_DN49473_c0_g1_i1:411-3800(+)